MDAQLTILDEVHARLGNLTKANEYRIDVVPEVIKRAKLTPFKSGDFPAINYWSAADLLDIKTGSKETRQLNLAIEIYSTTRDEPFTNVATRLGNDVVTALFRDTSAPKVSDLPSAALGGLVERIVVNSITPVISEGENPWCGAVLDLEVKYNIEVGNFTTILKY